MDITEAIENLITSEQFKANAKQKTTVGSRYRMFVSNYRRDRLTLTTILAFLLEHGYEMIITPPDESKPVNKPIRKRMKKRNFGVVNKETNGTVNWEQLQNFIKGKK